MKVIHWSDCAIYNAPAYEPGPCNCGAAKSGSRFDLWLGHHAHILAAHFGNRLRGFMRRRRAEGA